MIHDALFLPLRPASWLLPLQCWCAKEYTTAPINRRAIYFVTDLNWVAAWAKRPEELKRAEVLILHAKAHRTFGSMHLARMKLFIHTC